MKSIKSELFEQNELDVNEMKNALGGETLKTGGGYVGDFGYGYEYIDTETDEISIVMVDVKM